MASGGTTQIINLYTGGTGVLVKYVENSSTQIVNLYTGGTGSLVKYTENGSTQYINLYTGGSGVVTAASYQPVGSLIAGVSILPTGMGVGTTQISGGSVSRIDVLDTVTNYKYAVTEFNDGVATAPVIHGSKLSQQSLIDLIVITADANGVHTSNHSFNDAMTVAGSYSGYKLGSGNVAATVTVQSSASGTKYVNSTAYDVVLTYGQVLGVKPVSGGSVGAVQTLGTGSIGAKQGIGNSQANLEVQANLTWYKQSSGSLLALTLSNQFGSGYKVSRASVNKVVIVNAYGEDKAYFKVTLACLHSRYYIVTTLVPKYLVHTALFPVTISATILTTKCATLAVTHSSNIGKQITLTSRILACQKECY